MKTPLLSPIQSVFPLVSDFRCSLFLNLFLFLLQTDFLSRQTSRFNKVWETRAKYFDRKTRSDCLFVESNNDDDDQVTGGGGGDRIDIVGVARTSECQEIWTGRHRSIAKNELFQHCMV